MSETGIWPIRDTNGRWKWVLVGALTIELGKPGSGYFFTVPDGFVSDLVTRPKSPLVGWLIDANDPQTARAAIIHDALLTAQFEERVAAGEFYRALAADGVARWKAVLFYAAVVAASSNWQEQFPPPWWKGTPR